MKALSVRQPWALHINDGRKKLEFRTWATNYRGELLICASKHDSGVWVEVEVDGHKQVLPAPLGCQMCVVELLDVRPACMRGCSVTCSRWSQRPFRGGCICSTSPKPRYSPCAGKRFGATLSMRAATKNVTASNECQKPFKAARP